MKIAVACNERKVYSHFGETKEFYCKEGEIEYMISSGDASHKELVNVLKNNDIDVLICGGIGSGAIMFLNQANIKVCVTKETDPKKACEDYLNGTLVYTSEPTHICGHHHN